MKIFPWMIFRCLRPKRAVIWQRQPRYLEDYVLPAGRQLVCSCKNCNNRIAPSLAQVISNRAEAKPPNFSPKDSGIECCWSRQYQQKHAALSCECITTPLSASPAIPLFDDRSRAAFIARTSFSPGQQRLRRPQCRSTLRPVCQHNLGSGHNAPISP